jgi:hypothetical protein
VAKREAHRCPRFPAREAVRCLAHRDADARELQQVVTVENRTRLTEQTELQVVLAADAVPRHQLALAAQTLRVFETAVRQGVQAQHAQAQRLEGWHSFVAPSGCLALDAGDQRIRRSRPRSLVTGSSCHSVYESVAVRKRTTCTAHARRWFPRGAACSRRIV